MTKTDTIPDCKRFNLFSVLPALLLLTGVIFLTILPNAWSNTPATADVTAVVFKTTGPYKVGDTITAQVQFDEMIDVTGTPQLTLIIGETEKTVNYALTALSTARAMAFDYTVVAGDTDTDGVSVKANSLSLNGGSIVDVLRNAATLTHVAVADAGDSHRVDKTPPTVTSVEIASTGPYGIGSNIIVKATMSEVVNVIGTPRITIVLGTTERIAEYTSGTGTKVLLFQYTVQTGDADADGISVKQDSLALTAPNRQSLSDGIRDNAENPADLTHNAVADAGNNHRVDTAIPTVSTIAFTSTGPYRVGDHIEVTATLSKIVTVTGTPTLTLIIGNTDRIVNYHSGSRTSALIFQYTVTQSDTTNGNGISVRANSLALKGATIRDAVGNTLNLNHETILGSGSIHQVNTMLLAVSSIAFTSTGPYKSWDDIEVTVTAAKPVIVTGNATLKIVIGNREKTAQYHSGSGTTALLFRYTVATGDGDDTNGISVRANSLSTNGGTIKDTFGNDMNLNHDAVADGGDSQRVDTTPPSVRSLAFTSTGPYGVGNIIEVMVVTSETVKVVGTPTLTFTIGNTEKIAQYYRDFQADALFFRYTVTAGDGDDTNGVSVKANSLSLNGGIIMDPLGNNLDLKHNALANGGDSQIVGTTVSGISSLALTSTGPYKLDDTITVTVQTTEKVTVTGIPRIPMIFGTGRCRHHMAYRIRTRKRWV